MSQVWVGMGMFIEDEAMEVDKKQMMKDLVDFILGINEIYWWALRGDPNGSAFAKDNCDG